MDRRIASLHRKRAKTSRLLSTTFGLILAALLLAALPSNGQFSAKKTPPSQFKLIAIEVTGNKHYPSEQIIAVSGLHLGQNVSDNGKTVNEDIFREAARRVGDTAAFHDVSYRYDYSAAGTKLELQVSEGDKFVRAVFDNFVWFTNQELVSDLKSQVPLFDGSLPATGTLPDRIAQVLQRMIDDRKVSGTVEFILAGTEGGPLGDIKYKVSGVPIRIHQTAFPGAGTAETPLLQAAAKPLQGHEYSRSMLRVQEQKNFLPVFLARGYLRAKFQDSEASIEHGDQDATIVDVQFPVFTGLQYKLKEIRWAGNIVLPTDKLQPSIHLRPGTPANAVQLDDDIEAVRRLYGTLGYITAQIIASPVFDDASSSVTYTLEVKEGDQFRMGKLEVEGLDASTTQAVMRVWKLKSGEVYDASYDTRRISTDLGAARLRIPPTSGITLVQKVNPAGKTVDVKIIFSSQTSP